MAPPVFSHLCSKSRNLLSQLYKWPPQIFWTLAPPDFSTCLRPCKVLKVGQNIGSEAVGGKEKALKVGKDVSKDKKSAEVPMAKVYNLQDIH